LKAESSKQKLHLRLLASLPFDFKLSAFVLHGKKTSALRARRPPTGAEPLWGGARAGGRKKHELHN